MWSRAGQDHTGASTSLRMVSRRTLASPEPPSSSPASFLNEERKGPEASVSTGPSQGSAGSGLPGEGSTGTLEAGGPVAPFRRPHSWFWKPLWLRRSRARGLCPGGSGLVAGRA